MRKTLITAALLSAIIRKDMKEVYASILDHEGKEEGATEVRDSSRMTKALVDRTANLEDEGTDTEDPKTDPAELDYADEAQKKSLDDKVAHAVDDFKAVEKAIKKGKGKKALKLIAAMEEGGARGSVLKNLKKQAKEL